MMRAVQYSLSEGKLSHRLGVLQKLLNAHLSGAISLQQRLTSYYSSDMQ